jgi:hypothetical protein
VWITEFWVVSAVCVPEANIQLGMGEAIIIKILPRIQLTVSNEAFDECGNYESGLSIVLNDNILKTSHDTDIFSFGFLFSCCHMNRYVVHVTLQRLVTNQSVETV